MDRCVSPGDSHVVQIPLDNVIIDYVVIKSSRFNIVLGETANIYCCPFHVNIFFLIGAEKNAFANSRATFHLPGHVNLLPNLHLTQQLQMWLLLG